MGGPVFVEKFAAVGGLYTRKDLQAVNGAFVSTVVETVRLDLDGWFPQNIASGWSVSSLALQNGWVHWVTGRIEEVARGVWEGEITETENPVLAVPSSMHRETCRPAVTAS